ncbi:MAG: FKBP-type peptidyl-prolyl cis-trans isomerase [Prevotella sp.]
MNMKHLSVTESSLGKVGSLLLLCVFTMLASCSKDTEAPDEYENWAERNTDYYHHLMDSVNALLAGSPERTDWRVLKAWTKPADKQGAAEDYIIVNVLPKDENLKVDEALKDIKPIYTDSVDMHYIGRLIPTTSYPEGAVFDRSYYPPLDRRLVKPSRMGVNNLVVGVGTALMNMTRGDHWKVYVPSALGYGSSDYSGIKGGSVLVFEITLDNIISM